MRPFIVSLALLAGLSACTAVPADLSVNSDDSWRSPGKYDNFIISGEARTPAGASAVIGICRTSDGGGYEILFQGGPVDGTLKTGSLLHVRNIYRTQTEEGEWFPFEIAVRGRNISVDIAGKPVVCYTEPENPWRGEGHEGQRIARGRVDFKGLAGTVDFRGLALEALPQDAVNPGDTLPPVDEQNDGIIRLQQRDFPVIDYHVHLKGGLTKEMAIAKQMNYGINYGVAPNAGWGGVGRMLLNDDEVYEYYDELKDEPFLLGVQGEGRKWNTTFSRKALGVFEYLFTDAMTIIDQKGRNSRIYRAEEVRMDGLTEDQYMDVIVNETVRILETEPADIYANPTYIPDCMNDEYDKFWTDERIDRVLDVLEKYHIALEINPRYKIPSIYVIKKAKERGIKFTFGTNNGDANFGRLEYALETVEECGITAEDMWFPPMSIRSRRYLENQ